MSLVIQDFLIVVCLFIGMLVFLEAGWQWARSVKKQDPDGFAQGIGAFEGAIYGLMGLLVAFTFSGAATRFEDRRHLIVEEANAIGTAYLRLDLLPASSQPELRDLFRHYVDSRITVMGRIEDKDVTRIQMAKEQTLQNEIWSKALLASAQSGAMPDATKLLLPSLNEMIDITTTRLVATQNHPPMVIFYMLYGISLASSLLAGYGMATSKGRSWLHRLLFAGVISLAVYVVMDLEFPRRGLIRVDNADQILVELRKSMG